MHRDPPAREVCASGPGGSLLVSGTPRRVGCTIVDVEPIEREASAFDEYDVENGYEDDVETEENPWKSCGEILDRVIKIAIRLLKNSYSQCMREDVVSLLEYLKFELDTVNENK